MTQGSGPTSDDARIERHNREIMEWRRRYDPLVASITRQQARAIVDLGLRQGLSMNLVAREMQGKLDFEVPLDRDIVIGRDLYSSPLRCSTCTTRTSALVPKFMK